MMRFLQAETLLISDVHLGSPLSRSKKLWEVLESWSFSRLVIVGDLFATSNLRDLKEDDWDFLIYLSHRQHEGSEVVWLEGNHDKGAQPLSHLLGFPILQEYEWEWGEHKCLALHGHQFDQIIDSMFSTFINWIYLGLLKNSWIRNHGAEFISKASTHFQNIPKDVRKGCLSLAKDKSADYVFAGHTHHYELVSHQGVHYINTGSWVDKTSTLIVLQADGAARTFFY